MSEEMANNKPPVQGGSPWTMLRSQKLKLRGAKNDQGKSASLGLGFWQDCPRFSLFMNNGKNLNKETGREQGVTVGLAPIDFEMILQAIRTVATAAPETSPKFVFNCKNSYDHRGNSFNPPQVTATVFVYRNKQQAVTIAIQPRDEDMFSFVFGSDFFGFIQDGSGEEVSLRVLSEMGAMAYVNYVSQFMVMYALHHATEPQQKERKPFNKGQGGGGGWQNRNGGGGNWQNRNNGGGGGWQNRNNNSGGDGGGSRGQSDWDSAAAKFG